jgi:hypothetical protein
MRRLAIAIVALAASLVTVAPATAEGVTPDQLRNAGWTCFVPPPFPDRIVCGNPAQGLPPVPPGRTDGPRTPCSSSTVTGPSAARSISSAPTSSTGNRAPSRPGFSSPDWLLRVSTFLGNSGMRWEREPDCDLEARLGAPSASLDRAGIPIPGLAEGWRAVRAALASETPVCPFDRAGLGASDRRPTVTR